MNDMEQYFLIVLIVSSLLIIGGIFTNSDQTFVFGVIGIIASIPLRFYIFAQELKKKKDKSNEIK